MSLIPFLSDHLFKVPTAISLHIIQTCSCVLLFSHSWIYLVSCFDYINLHVRLTPSTFYPKTKKIQFCVGLLTWLEVGVRESYRKGHCAEHPVNLSYYTWSASFSSFLILFPTTYQNNQNIFLFLFRIIILHMWPLAIFSCSSNWACQKVSPQQI